MSDINVDTAILSKVQKLANQSYRLTVDFDESEIGAATQLFVEQGSRGKLTFKPEGKAE